MQSNHSNEWSPCPKGEFARLNLRLARKKRRRRFLQFAGGATAVGLAAALGVSLQPIFEPEKKKVARVTCKEVLNGVDAFAHNKLSPQVRHQFVEHLKHCKRCDQLYREQGLVS